jgi:glycerol 2-dehydrogenase (NADP+)
MPLPISFKLSSGYFIPSLAFGTYEPDESQRQAVMLSTLTALRVGYRCIDSAWTYGTEKPVGEAIRSSGLQREDIFLITKVYVLKLERNNSRWNHMHRYVRESVEQSLRNFGDGIDYIDLLLLHCAGLSSGSVNIRRADCLPNR